MTLPQLTEALIKALPKERTENVTEDDIGYGWKDGHNQALAASRSAIREFMKGVVMDEKNIAETMRSLRPMTASRPYIR